MLAFLVDAGRRCSCFGGLAAVLPAARRRDPGPGAARPSEILYAFSSATGNNGSAFAGFAGNTPFYNTTLGHRDAARPLRLYRADAGARRHPGGKKTVPASAGTFPTDGPLFVAARRR